MIFSPSSSLPSSMTSIAHRVVVILLSLPVALSLPFASELTWESRSSYDSSAAEDLGRHHPITFANETHGLFLGGSTSSRGVVPDLHVYDEANDSLDRRERLSAKAYLGFGSGADGREMSDWWEFDISARFPGEGRRHPSMVPVFVDDEEGNGGGGGGGGGGWHIHVGLGDGFVIDEDLGGVEVFKNFDDYWSYSVTDDEWTHGHHPYYFGLGGASYVGFGHASEMPYIRGDFHRYEDWEWHDEADFASYEMTERGEDGDIDIEDETLVTTEGRVAGTQFSIVLPLRRVGVSSNSTATTTGGGEALSGSMGFVLSGDGDDHNSMPTGEFHAFHPVDDDYDDGGPSWRALPPHPGASRWAPGSFVMRGSARAYFMCGYDRTANALRSDVWGIDLSPLFRVDDLVVVDETATTTMITANATTVPPAADDSGIAPVAPSTAPSSSTGVVSLPVRALVFGANFVATWWLVQ
ncbi:hypothetical protein ACHAW5_005665 [Stephanodiscus triporus]|uniref:Uncharacterized protein n=1 Tax=Stephanodiscus triporus TaxID=2934178 RepID=A0ABD3PEM6_9STRA